MVKHKIRRMEAQMKISLALLAGYLIALGSCGDETSITPRGQTPSPVAWKNRPPVLHAATPNALSVGESLVVLGQDYIPDVYGYPLLQIKGTYFNDQGQSHAVDRQDKARLVNSGKISWSLWPNIVFDPTGMRLGSFVGSIVVINVHKDGSQEISNELPVKIDVKPSLIPRSAQPQSGGCKPVVGATVEDTPFNFTVEAIGLRPGTKEAPLTFYWTFLPKYWNVSLTDMLKMPATLHDDDTIMLEEQVTSGQASAVSDAGINNLLLKINSDILGQGRLKVLRTGKKIPQEGNSFIATVNVAAKDASGKSISLSIPLEIFRVATMSYDGNAKVVERFEPELVSDCMSGGDIGRSVTYDENKSESHGRSLNFQWNGNANLKFNPYPANPFLLDLNFSAGFGMDISASVNSSEADGMNISGQILPGDFGVFYRQTVRIARIGKLIGHTVCGDEVDMGRAVLTDWIFTPDLATGSRCIPPSKLPPAAVLN